MSGTLPRSRQGLVVTELDGELLVYDQESQKAFCLNASSAAIWRMCDGRTTLAEIAERAGRELGVPVDETFVTYALDRLRKDGLLEADFRTPAEAAAVSRVELIRRIGRVGMAAAIAVPLVTAVVAPTAAKAYGHGEPPPPPIFRWPPDPWGCVLYSTEIVRADGSLATARDIAEGDWLTGVRAENGEFVAGAVASVVEVVAPGFYTFVAESGDVVNCSPTHALLRGYGDRDGTPAAQFKPGDPLLVRDAQSGRAIESPIISAAYVDLAQPVLLFEMDSSEHTYVTGGIVSHNKLR